MAAPTGIRSGVGFRNAVVFALNAAGLPAATSTAVYEGVRITGNKVLTINDPEPRRIAHMGDDMIFEVDVLPPGEVMTSELRTGKMNDILDAMLADVKAFTVGEMAMLGIGTDKRGYEPQVGLLAYRQAKDTDPTSATSGLRSWETRIFPKATLYARETGFSDQPEDHPYTVVPGFTNTHLWGTAFSTATEGFSRANLIRAVSWGKPKLVAWKADGTEDEFLLPTDAPALATTTMTVWDNGTIVSAGLTKAITKLTFTAAPTTGHIIVCLYETA